MPYQLLIKAASRATGRLGWARPVIGATLGVFVAATTGLLFFGSAADAPPWIMAPVGASAILVFALPASPLAQPWPVLGGNLISVLAGLIAAHFIALPALACAVAVGAALSTMSLARCLHPPGGGGALLGVMCAPLVAAHGWMGVLLPLTLNLVAMLGAGWLYNHLTGHPWPHRATPVPPLPASNDVIRYEAADLDAVLEDWDEVLDVSRNDLDALFRAVERRVHARTLSGR